MTAFIPLLSLAFAVGCGSEDDDTAGHPHHGGDEPEDVNYTTEATTDGGTWTLTYTAVPDPIVLSDNFSLMVTVSDANDLDATASLTINATMPAHNHGMNTEAVVRANGDGTFAVDGLQFHMSGRWRIDALVSAPDRPEESAWFDINCCD